jgi:F-type H+-transporting ATPase subunit epsilon
MNFIKVEITTPLKHWAFENVISITSPGIHGTFQILFNHAPLINKLDIGAIKLELENEAKYFATSGGFLEVVNNKVFIVLATCEEAEKIDVERAQSAMKRAKDRLKKQDKDIDLIRAEAALSRAVNRLKVAERIGLTAN